METAKILHKDYNGDIPKTIEGLVALPGVGEKMAYLCMQAAWGEYVFFLSFLSFGFQYVLCI